jgi:hypothetical protein
MAADINYNQLNAAGQDATGATSRARVGGSGATFFTWNAQIIGFARQISHTSPAPVAPPAPIHPLDSRYPVEIVTPLAAGMGQLQVELYELYGQYAWDRLAGIAGSVDIVDIFYRVANSTNPITMVKVIKPPTVRGRKMAPYSYEYHNCVITDVGDGETIEVGTMEVLKTITVAYTHMTRGGVGSIDPANHGVAPANGFNMGATPNALQGDGKTEFA